MPSKEDDSRYPYTYAADLVRQHGPIGKGGLSLARSDASKLRTLFATVLGMDDHALACKLADYYLANQDDLTEKNVQALLHSIAMR